VSEDRKKRETKEKRKETDHKVFGDEGLGELVGGIKGSSNTSNLDGLLEPEGKSVDVGLDLGVDVVVELFFFFFDE
jgi:hypothetical protein